MKNKPVKLIAKIYVVFTIILVIMILMSWHTTTEYENLVRNVNRGSHFNINFKEKIDLMTYHYVVNPKMQKTLPYEELDKALEIAQDLKKDTVLAESIDTLERIENYSENLKNKMKILQVTKDYDEKMNQLDTNIYVLTELIQEEMGNYIYYEAKYMEKVSLNLAKSTNTRTYIIFMLMSLLLIGAVYNGYILVKKLKRDEENKRDIQLRLLQAQINPHFLYNTLDAIVWLTESGEYDDAIDMVANLSVFFKIALSKGKDVITLKEEIRHTRSYLEIQKARYKDILDYSINISESVENEEVHKLTIQPLVENALYHGIKEKRGKGKIEVSVYEEKNDIVIKVEDNGVGISSEKLEEIRREIKKGEGNSFGLRAVNERLRLFYGEDEPVKIESSEGKGTSIYIRFPKKIKI